MTVRPKSNINYELNTSNNYDVLAILISNEEWEYLIYNDSHSTTTYSTELFELIDNKVPEYWKISITGDNDYTNNNISLEAGIMLFGYPEIIESKFHLVNLIDSPGESDKNILSNYLRQS